MTPGRPSPYKQAEVAKGVEQYIKDCKMHSYLPTVEGLAVHLNVNRSTIYEWRQKHPRFSDIIERMLSLQASQLIQNGLVDVYNSTITKLLLTKHRGADSQPYKDKSDVTTDDKPLNEIKVTFND